MEKIRRWHEIRIVALHNELLGLLLLLGLLSGPSWRCCCLLSDAMLRERIEMLLLLLLLYLLLNELRGLMMHGSSGGWLINMLNGDLLLLWLRLKCLRLTEQFRSIRLLYELVLKVLRWLIEMNDLRLLLQLLLQLLLLLLLQNIGRRLC